MAKSLAWVAGLQLTYTMRSAPANTSVVTSPASASVPTNDATTHRRDESSSTARGGSLDVNESVAEVPTVRSPAAVNLSPIVGKETKRSLGVARSLLVLMTAPPKIDQLLLATLMYLSLIYPQIK